MIRIKKGIPLLRNIFIVCEDTNTAPNYLFEARRDAISKGCWDFIEIHPSPPNENVENEANAANPHKTQRKKRQFIEVGVLTIVVEREYKEQPVRYVRIAQKAIEDGTYEEGWAVYDLDGHTGHERAAALAGGNVKIAFSSRSIEVWFLLHFRQFNYEFQKTTCKNEGGKELKCSLDLPCVDDEKGECLVGFLRRNTSFDDYEKNMKDIYDRLRPFDRQALINAAWLRMQYDSNTPFYQRNPYTSMDALMKRLFRLMLTGDRVTLKEYELTLVQFYPSICIELTNRHLTNRQIISKQLFGLFDGDGNEVDFDLKNSGILEAQEKRVIEIISTQNDEQPLKLKFPRDNEYEFVRMENEFS